MDLLDDEQVRSISNQFTNIGGKMEQQKDLFVIR
jgi:hypothetical protein